MIHITVLSNSTESLQNRSTILPLFIGPYAAATLRRFSMKALARYQVILLGEKRHIRCEQLAQGCCPNNAAVGVEPATSRSWVWRPTATLPSHQSGHFARLVSSSHISVTSHCWICSITNATIIVPSSCHQRAYTWLSAQVIVNCFAIGHSIVAQMSLIIQRHWPMAQMTLNGAPPFPFCNCNLCRPTVQKCHHWTSCGKIKHKRTKILATRWLSWAPNMPQMLHWRGSVPDPAGGAYSSVS